MIKRIIIVTFAVIIVVVGLQSMSAGAIWGGRGRFEGYFDGDYLPYGYNPGSWPSNGYVLPPDHGGIAIPSNINSINELMNFLQNHYNQGQPTQSMVSFIVHTMLKVSGKDATRSVSSAEWTELETRLRQPGITIDWNTYHSSSKNVGHQATDAGRRTSNRDVFYDTAGQAGPSIVIRYKGTAVYVLFHSCANPDGNLGGIPPPSNSWKITPTTLIDRTSANPGDTVTWTHRIRNTGDDPTDKNVNYWYEADFSPTSGSNHSAGSGFTTTDKSESFTSTYKIAPDVISAPDPVTGLVTTTPSPDRGKIFCRSTAADPKSSVSNGKIVSDPKCVGVDVYVIPPQWSVTPGVTVDVNGTVGETIASIGDVINWKHTVTSSGPNETGAEVYYTYENTQGLPAGSGNYYDNSLPEGTSVGDFASFVSNPSYTVQTGDGGKTFCRRTKAQPHASWDYGEVRSGEACVSVPYEYTLTPHISFPTEYVEAGGSVTTDTLYINNSGPTQSEPDSEWKLTKKIGSGAEVPKGSGSGITFLEGDTHLSPYSDSETDEPAGTRLCYTLSVRKHTQDDPGWATAEACVTIGKKPKVQVWGGDLFVGGLVRTSTSDKKIGSDTRRFGSWVEYGMIANSTINGAGSGAAFANNGLPASPSPCTASALSFTNATSPTSNCSGSQTIGNYTNTRTMPDVAASFPTNASTPAPQPNLDNLQGIYTTSGNFTISGGNISKGRWIVINAPTANITIAGNITYTPENLSFISDIPQVVIIANTITINSGVENVDAWLIAKTNDNSSISTCGDQPGININECKQPLRVNGPVMTNHLYLKRTYGSGTGTNSGDPAEIFNLRADSYLWSVGRATSNGRIQTVYTTELPPRL